MSSSDKKDNPRIAIVGAGLGGALMATYLGKAGYEVEAYERRSDPRDGGGVGGRSINLAISVRGIHALTELGVADEIMKLAIPMRGRMIHARHGGLSFQPYDRDPGKCIYSISRAGLNTALIEAADGYDTVRLKFGHTCVGVDPDRPSLTMSVAGDEVIVEPDVILGTDGAYSAVCGQMQRLDRFDFSRSFLEHGYKELCVPPTSSGEFAMDPNALHIWPRRSFMMIALPNPDKTFTCTLFLPFEGAISFDRLKSDAEVRDFFNDQFPDAVERMPTLLADFQRNPTGSLATVRSGPWHHRDKVLLLGDAAHAVVPFYGQGMNCAFEDCTVLSECIERYAPDWGRIFQVFYDQRKRNADAIADLALRNFVEMRDRTGSRLFRLEKGLERAMHRVVPGYVPLYSMVSFSRRPYADAVLQARRQNRVATWLAAFVFVVLVLTIGIMI